MKAQIDLSEYRPVLRKFFTKVRQSRCEAPPWPAKLPVVAIFFCICMLCRSGWSSEPIRIWVDVGGLHSVEAQLISKDDDMVTLLRRDGGVAKLRVDQLSERDKEYLDAYDDRLQAKENPLRSTPPKIVPVKPLPVLDLPASRQQAEEGAALELTQPTRPFTPAQLPASIQPDRSPWNVNVTDARIRFPKIDVHDVCSRAIAVGGGQNSVERLAISVRKGLSLPGQSSQGRLMVFDPAEETMNVLWTGSKAIRLCDYHAGSGRGLVLIGQDSLGQGGRLAVASGWSGDEIEFTYQRSVAKRSAVGGAPRVRWARWVDEEHFVAVIDDTIGLWNIVSGKQVYRIAGIDSRSLPAISGGRRYVALPREGVVEIRRSVDGVAVGKIPVESNSIPGVAFASGGRSLAVATPRRLRVWDLATSSLSADVRTRQSLGKRPPIWIDDDLVLSSSGVLISLFRSLPVWRYELTGTVGVAIGDRVALIRKHPVTELSLVSLPHRAAKQAMQWMDDRGSEIDTDNWNVLGRSDWIGGYWSDRDIQMSRRSTFLR